MFEHMFCLALVYSVRLLNGIDSFPSSLSIFHILLSCHSHSLLHFGFIFLSPYLYTFLYHIHILSITLSSVFPTIF
ncbi:hypothetical protein F5879DRAFT_979827 [Lentinula edodes]|nr:hypothetical protein F5879DRAFT_979827 [Lentinula edodes]